jgi:hypothetical protein
MADDNNIKALNEEIRKAKEGISRYSAELERLDAQVKSGIALNDLQKRAYAEMTRARRAAREEVEKQEKAVKALSKATEEYNKAAKQTGELLDAAIPGLGKVAALLEKNAEGTIDFTGNLKDLSKTLSTQFIAGTRKTAVSLDELNVSLAQQTGYTRALQQDVIDLASSHDGLFLSLAEGGKTVAALSTGFKIYNTLTKESRKSVNRLGGEFLQMGVNADETAAILDQLNDGFGLAVPAAVSAAAELENLAIRTGQPLSAVVSDFKDLGPQMSRFGIDGTRVFSRLNEQARTLGLTTRQAFDFSELFDTFEGSANVAGKLNAQLGMQLNSVELMTADSDERLKILRAEFDLRGMNFQTMGKRQKQMIADIMGTDVTGASKLFGSPAELRKYQKDEAGKAERLKKFASATKKFQELQEQMFINLAPFLNSLMSAINSMLEGTNKFMSSGLGKALSTLLLMLSATGGISLIVRITKMVFGLTKSVLGLNAATAATGSVFGKILPFMGPLIALWNASKMFTGETAAEKESGAWSVLGAIGGGIVGGLVGGPAGALIGMGIGSSMMSGVGAEEVNDAVIPSGQSAVISQPGKRPIKTNRMDTISASTGDRGSLGDMNKALGEIKNLLAKSQNQKADIRLEIGGQRLDTFRDALLKPLDPMRARA